MNRSDSIKRLHDLSQAQLVIEQASALLQWDQETQMPISAIKQRSEQISALDAIAHERATTNEIGDLLEIALGSDKEAISSVELDFLQVLKRDYEKARCLPTALVRAASRDEALSQDAWAKARSEDDFSSFVPHLHKMIDYAKQKASLWGFEGHPYDGLIDHHEYGASENWIGLEFDALRPRLSSLVARIAERPQKDASFLSAEYPLAEQERFNQELIKKLGFDLDRGRLDRSVHPFTTTLGPDDVRITSRYSKTSMASAISSTIHETGHALYEQGFGKDIHGSLLASGTSMGIHESQSRLWENLIGRSLAFWKALFPELRTAFPSQVSGKSPLDFYYAINRVEPSLIRVDADEVSYSLHIILRFDLERRLFSGSLAVEDLPDAWRSLMKEYLGIVPPSDAEGVLQDVHWSIGAFGYFPSYALGNLYGLQFWKALKKDIPDIDAELEQGHFEVPLHWCRKKIHSVGRRLKADELLSSVCGETLSAEPFIEYLETKYSAIYSL